LTKGYAEKNKGIDTIEVFGFLNSFFKYTSLVSLGGAAAYGMASSESYASVTRDFTEETRESLLKLVEEVEEEPDWDVTKWDVFSRVEKFFGGIDFPGNSSELNNYYRKIIDINETSADEINRIFDAVYTEESQFNTKMQTVCEQLENVSAALKKLTDSIE